MSTSQIPEALRKCVLEALEDARRRRHEYVTLEHLLLALTEEARTREILQACGATMKQLRQALDSHLNEALEQLPEGLKFEPEPTVSFGRVLAQAVCTPGPPSRNSRKAAISWRPCWKNPILMPVICWSSRGSPAWTY